MPIRRKGYHRWEGELGSDRWTWRAILANGLTLGLKQKHAALLLWAALPLAVVAGVLFYLMAVLQKQVAGDIGSSDMLKFFLGLLRLGGVFSPDIGKMVMPMWTLLFARLIQAELMLVLLVQAKFGADLISGDLRTNALPIYFSKPVTVSTYLLGKWLVVAAFASAVTLVPNLLAYTAGILVSDTLAQLRLTLGLLAGVVLTSVLIAGLSSLVILALSALTSDRRIVVVAWLALALLPSVVQERLDSTASGACARGLLGSVSMYRNANRLTYWMLDVEDAVSASGQAGVFRRVAGGDVLGVDVGYSLAVLGGIALLCLFMCVKRVRRFQVAAANT